MLPKIQWYIPPIPEDPTEDTRAHLISILKKMDIDVYTEPFNYSNASFAPIDPARPAIVYGTIESIKWLQRRDAPFVSPGFWCRFDQLRCSAYYAHYSAYLVQQDYAYYPGYAVHEKRDLIFKTFAENDHVFIRPDENDKTFNARVIKPAHTEVFFEMYPYVLCLVARPIQIDEEWRLIMLDDKVITGSRYMLEGQLAPLADVPQIVIDAAEKIAKSTVQQVHPIYAMDIARIGDDYKLLEISSVNCAGLYACDLQKFVAAVHSLLPDEFLPPS